MKTLQRLLLLALLPAALNFSSQACFAQNDGYLSSNNLRGVITGNSYQFSNIDNINLGTGAINIRIPLISVKGRGVTDEYVYFYSSKIWVASPEWDYVNPTLLDSLDWVPTDQRNAMIAKNPGGQPTWFEQEYDCQIGQVNLQEFVDTNFAYITNDGATYKFGNRHVWNGNGTSPSSESCPGVNISRYEVMQSNEGVMQLDSTNITWNTFPVVTMKNGARIPTSNSVEDTNGNLESGKLSRL